MCHTIDIPLAPNPDPVLVVLNAAGKFDATGHLDDLICPTASLDHVEATCTWPGGAVTTTRLPAAGSFAANTRNYSLTGSDAARVFTKPGPKRAGTSGEFSIKVFYAGGGSDTAIRDIDVAPQVYTVTFTNVTDGTCNTCAPAGTGANRTFTLTYNPSSQSWRQDGLTGPSGGLFLCGANFAALMIYPAGGNESTFWIRKTGPASAWVRYTTTAPWDLTTSNTMYYQNDDGHCIWPAAISVVPTIV